MKQILQESLMPQKKPIDAHLMCPQAFFLVRKSIIAELISDVYRMSSILENYQPISTTKVSNKSLSTQVFDFKKSWKKFNFFLISHDN